LLKYSLGSAFNPIDNLAMLSSFHGKKGGHSGAFIFSTHDKRFVIKTITAKEKILLLNKLLPDYLQRILSKNSCLVRIVGIFMLQCSGNYSTNLMVMEQVGPGLHANFRYDIKGSKANRRNWSASLASESSVILKDNDFEDMVGRLSLRLADRDRLISAVAADSRMLASHGIMDYSLLITKVTHYNLESNVKYAYSTADQDEAVVLIAMIDILQQYDLSKKLETYWKQISRCQRYEQLSSIEPHSYSKRLIDFCQTIA
jgi:hypothetical protein